MVCFIRAVAALHSRDSMQNDNSLFHPPKVSRGQTGRWNRLSLFASRNLRNLLVVALSFFCLNVAVLSLIGSYDIRWGWVHLTAHGLFKPLLMMNGCFLLALMVGGASGYRNKQPGFAGKSTHSAKAYPALLPVSVLLIVFVLYSGSAAVNFTHHDWNHRHISAGIDSLSSVWELFTKPQADGFYRPLTFISLWMDFKLFGANYAGYHIQSIVLHAINALLVAWLAGALGFSKVNSLWSGLLFAAAAVNFEAVLWPAARFDLLATLFTLMALIAAVKYFRHTQTWSWMLPASLFCYIAAVMNKESGYSYPLLLLFIISTHRLWSIPRPPRNKALLCGALVAAVTVAMIFVRIAVYDSLGGYPTPASQQSAHFTVGLNTAVSLIRTVPAALLGVNTASASPGWLNAVVIAFSLLVFMVALTGAGRFGRREYALLACAPIAALPVMNLVIWIGSSMQHSRYLYMPAVFVMILMASALGKKRWSAFFLGTFLTLNALGVISNIGIYRDMLAKTESLAESVRMDWSNHPSARAIFLMDVPDSPSGVFFFAPELIAEIKEKIPGVKIFRQRTEGAAQSGDTARLVYEWNDEDGTLVFVP